MKTAQEIQLAHDQIVGVLLGEVPLPIGHGDEMALNLMASVLCWVLDHDHNQAFAQNLQSLRNDIEAAGFVIRKEGSQTCRECGCTDERACEGGCSWVEEDLCSACADKALVVPEQRIIVP
jgi:hypothetical protein